MRSAQAQDMENSQQSFFPSSPKQPRLQILDGFSEILKKASKYFRFRGRQIHCRATNPNSWGQYTSVVGRKQIAFSHLG